MVKKKPASTPIRILRSATAEDWVRIADTIVEINRTVGSKWLVSNGFPDDLHRAVKIAVAELGEFATSQDVGQFPMDNIRELLQTCVDRRQWLAKISKPDADRTIPATDELPFGVQRCDVPQTLKREGYSKPVTIKNQDHWKLMEALMAAFPNAVSEPKLNHIFQGPNDRDNYSRALKNSIDAIGLTVEKWVLTAMK